MPPAIPELLALKIELYARKLQLLEYQGEKLIAEQRACVDEARQIAGVPAEFIYNVETQAFQPPPVAPIPARTEG